MKRLTLALLLGSVFTFGCGQRLVELADNGTNPGGAAPVLTSILPQRGVVEGGTSVVLTGTALSGATEVAFGSATATFNVDSSTQITAISPPGTGSVNVTVVTSAGRSNGLPYAYGNAPIVTGITPSIGLVAGGQTVVVTGSALTGANAVRFGDAVATSFTVDSDSQITVVTPAHAAGTVQVVVTTAIAASNGFDFTYGETPTLASIDPTKGPTTGGTVVTLTGAHLTGATQVSFDATPGTALTVVDDTHVTVTTPAHAAGTAAVTVTTRFGTSSGVTFTYGVPPTLVSASPARSPTAGGASIILTGTNLLETTAVTFGSEAATSFTVDSDTQITAVAPAGTSSVNITVVTPYGTSNGLPFGYGDAPVETSLNPSIGLIAGGTSVVITGTRFTGAGSVKFGGVDATSFVVDSDTQITAVAPAHARGPVQVVTTTIDGSSNGLTFTYGAVPALTTAAPTTGTTLGGTSVVLTGTDLNGTTAVAFGLTPATSFTIDSATQITAVSPIHAAGAVQITATTAYGTSNGVTFTYGVTPALVTLNPASGDVDGGRSVVITGTALNNATDVLFGSTPATSFTINSATQITAVAPPAAAVGSVNVTVASPYGTSNGLAFAYGNAPTITTLSPSVGLTAGGNTVTINGTGFTSTSTVLFGSSSLTPTFVSATQLTVTAPADTAGPKNVTVTNAFGTSNAATYTYGVAPTISSISPTAGPSGGGTTVTITGTGLSGTTSVTFGGAAGTSLTNVSATQVTVTTPSGSAGPAAVVLTTAFGTATTSFTYVDAPTISAISPVSGSTVGGTTVVITGTNLATAASVTFDTPATIVSATNTSVTVTTPAHAAGIVDVVVTTAGGSATLAGAYTFVTPPSIASVSPINGPSAGGQSVTITGANLSGTSSVTFGGTDATIDAVTSTSLTVTTPSHSTGTVDVVVTTDGGTATAAGSYTFIASPSITSLNPTTGSVAGGTVVTITGADLATASSVTFDGLAATSLNAVNDTTLEVTTPAHAAGSVDVVVTTSAGSASVTNAYTYVP